MAGQPETTKDTNDNKNGELKPTPIATRHSLVAYNSNGEVKVIAPVDKIEGGTGDLATSTLNLSALNVLGVDPIPKQQ